MRWFNEYEIEEMSSRARRDNLPNALKGAEILERLADWANTHSDGWAYWPKPARAAASLTELLAGVDRFDPEDIAPADLAKALRPIKAFLTRQGVDHGEVIA